MTDNQQQSVEDLLKRIEALEIGGRFDATKSAVQTAQMEMLITLREIRSSMKSGESAGAVSNSKEVGRLQAENVALKTKCAKQEYRIQHLVDTVEELLAKRSGGEVRA